MRRSRKSLRESLHRMLIERARKLCQPRGQLQSLRLSFNYFASCDGNIRVVEFLWLMRIAPQADFEFCSTKKKSWNVFTGASLFRGLLREILFLLFPRVTIRSYRMKLPFFCCSKEKRYIFETIIFIRSKYEPLALMTFSQRDSQPIYPIFIKLYYGFNVKKFFECCDYNFSSILCFQNQL